MKRKNLILVALALVLVLGASMGSAWAYFTANAEAAGGYPIRLGGRTDIGEDFSAWTKHITVSNEEGGQPVYVRAKAFSGSEYSLIYSDASGLWTPGGDGYYYYGAILNGGETTDELLVKIAGVPEDADLEDAESFNVVVVYESTPVQYDEAGNPYADWSIKLDAGDAEGGAEE